MNAVQEITSRRDNAQEQYFKAAQNGNEQAQAVWHARREAYNNCLDILAIGASSVACEPMTVADVARLADTFGMQLAPKHIDEPVMLDEPRDEASIDAALNTLPGRLWMAYTARQNTLTSITRPGIVAKIDCMKRAMLAEGVHS